MAQFGTDVEIPLEDPSEDLLMDFKLDAASQKIMDEVTVQ